MVMRTILAALMVIAVAAPAAAKKSEINKSFFGGVAIEGTDPVAYFTEGRPIEGSKDFAHNWKGAEWRFTSAVNRDAFKADPGRYAPRFGGYCAFAVSRGYTASIDPEAWSIVGGRLYLNYSKSVKRQWQEDIPGNIALGERNWPKVLDD
ncbi:MAG: YHS domain-containing (seleno)protein [Alphaproteobacteria bacterium]|jgi:hypothetical protein|nr:YHS domain-containing (seleno)protein [Alphaproteobacteria bacterium]